MLRRSLALLSITFSFHLRRRKARGALRRQSVGWDTVKVISDDKYEGRDTGSKGERQAQEYIVGKLKGAWC